MRTVFCFGLLALALGTVGLDFANAAVAQPGGPATAQSRRDAVRETTRRAWQAYVNYAEGYDELQPLTGSGINNFGGVVVTAIDSLDTLWMMDLKREFKQAVDMVRGVNFQRVSGDMSFFETGIRVLGGLLSAYELSGESVLLTKATEIGNILIKAFDTPTGLPVARVNARGPVADSVNVVLAEIGSNQLEFAKLSEFTGNATYQEKSVRVFDILSRVRTREAGLIPVHLNAQTGQLNGDYITFGALGDSYYEYLLKYAILTGQRDGLAGRMYTTAINSMKLSLVVNSSSRPDRYFLAARSNGNLEPTMQHLTCFAPGMLSLGSQFLGNNDDFVVAQRLMQSCIAFYRESQTGLGPEAVRFDYGDSASALDTDSLDLSQSASLARNGYVVSSPSYILRPETIESLMYLYRTTGDTIHQAIEKHTRTNLAYSSIKDVNSNNDKDNHRNDMPSFFLAETLKYLYLLFSDSKFYPLNEYVFNTEAHPFRIQKRM
ncbi:hypothetical protein IWQ60_007400 [Tieghemiomyces parasiticus]|uniref:alpha-1,2-Mannosidase n=1 Tax=Tieghemiomyces parasiticus TaxID=78921 RepID=A0A9W8A5S7_9FUNG|nr:hypothetical protein IWQ60_007400 [Tieghemiomyces parasiticus]